MSLKRKKGFGIATKSMGTKLHREGVSFQPTKAIFNELVEFYFTIVDKHPEIIETPAKSNGGWRGIELMTVGDDPAYPMTNRLRKCPTVLKRAAIRKAIGAWSSWHTNFLKWHNRPKRERHHKPPMQPRQFGFNPQYDSGMWKSDDGFSIMLKVLVVTKKGESWRWFKFRYDSYSIGNEWVKGSPVVVIRGDKAYLNFPVEKYVRATGGTKNVMAQEVVRVLGVDLDLDENAAIVSVLEVEANPVREVARHFIPMPSGVQLRKRDLGRIAQRMSKTRIVHEGFCKSRWDKLRQRELEMGRDVARQIANLAAGYGCGLISFEHLKSLRPCRGKYSRRSNQKRAYWLKSKIFEGVKRIAYQDFGILTTRVSPRNTSKLDPWGNDLARQNQIDESVTEYQPGATWVWNEGYKAHSGLNAARNVGLKAIARYRTNPILEFSEKGKAISGNANGVR